MKNHECRKFYVLPLLVALIATALFLSACTTPEKAKAQHVSRGQALLKDKKFQEASLEFRAAIQIDDKLADAHMKLAEGQGAGSLPPEGPRPRVFRGGGPNKERTQSPPYP